MKIQVKVTWGITPVKKHLPEKILGEETIETKSMRAAKLKAKSLANRCKKLKEVYTGYTRTWIYWNNWNNNDENSAKVYSPDVVEIKYNKKNQDYQAFISIEKTVPGNTYNPGELFYQGEEK